MEYNHKYERKNCIFLVLLRVSWEAALSDKIENTHLLPIDHSYNSEEGIHASLQLTLIQ